MTAKKRKLQQLCCSNGDPSYRHRLTELMCDPDFADLTIRCEQTEWKVSKAVLGADRLMVHGLKAEATERFENLW